VHDALDDAIQAWRLAVGPEHVVTSAAKLARAANATFQTPHLVPAIVYPADRDQIRECLAIAGRHHVPLYPVSTGKNWGYGSGAPTADAAILDLSRLNRIVDFNEELAYVTVEPGVTQRQLYAFLKERGSRLWIDATGASPDCSIVGNTVERGFGHTPYGDHFAHVCGLEVVLASGEVVNTGFARFPGAKAGPVYRWGVGPVLDGLFSQSNLGIVTRMTVWLMPAPEYFQACFFRCDRDEDLPGLIDALRPLRLNGTLPSAAHIANDYKVAAGIQLYPWAEMQGRTPLTPEMMAPLRKKLNCGAWNGSLGLYGTRKQVAEARRLVRAALKGRVSKVQFLDDRKLGLAARFAKPYSLVSGWDISRALELVRPVYGLMQGVPTEHPLRSCYWRKRSIPDKPDVDRDRCGLLWCSPMAPLEGAHAAAISAIAHRLLLAHGFEPMISITLLTERAIGCVISIGYDRDVPGEDERASACHRQLLAELNAAGYYLYRLGLDSMGQMHTADGFNNLLRALKDTVDPEGILAPGRYAPC
jgi:4-cresol dehydrogenase (hydroxylating) flavoprotein subunit